MGDTVKHGRGMPMQLFSPTFDDGGEIPRKYGYRADNVNPPLHVTGLPDGTGAVAVVVDDPDAVEPAGTVWDHWLVWNLPPDDGAVRIPEAFDPAGTAAVVGTNDYDEVGYGGPNPPDREHSYRFRAYALDGPVDLAEGARKADLVSAMQTHIVDDAEVRGTYAS
jgi:Raf kinase inhibitor-like YbhB/YbcL family protein